MGKPSVRYNISLEKDPFHLPRPTFPRALPSQISRRRAPDVGELNTGRNFGIWVCWPSENYPKRRGRAVLVALRRRTIAIDVSIDIDAGSQEEGERYWLLSKSGPDEEMDGGAMWMRRLERLDNRSVAGKGRMNIDVHTMSISKRHSPFT